MHLTKSSAKQRPFCPEEDEFTLMQHQWQYNVHVMLLSNPFVGQMITLALNIENITAPHYQLFDLSAKKSKDIFHFFKIW